MNLQRDFIVAIILVVTVLIAGSRELPAQKEAAVKRNMTVSAGVPAQPDVSQQRTEENTATLQETLDWLQSKMSILKTYTKTGDSSDMSGDNTDVSRFEPGSFNSCTIVWREITGNSTVSDRYISEITIPLSDINPHSIMARDAKCWWGGDCYYVQLSTTKKSIKVHSTKIDDLTDRRVSQPRDTDKTTRVHLLDSLTLVETEQDEELAHRISGAMQHAVKLCCSGSNCNSNSNLPVDDSGLPRDAAERAALKHAFSEICPALLILPNLKAERVCADVVVDCSEKPPLTSADKANGMEDKWCVDVSYTMRSKPPPGSFPEWPDGKTSVLSYKEKGTWKAARIDGGNCVCRNRTLETDSDVARTKQAEAEQELELRRTRQSPLSISENFQEELKSKPVGEVVVVYVGGSSEVIMFTEALCRALRDAGWTVPPPTQISSVRDVVPEGRWSVEVLVIYKIPEGVRELPKHVQALSDALSNERFSAGMSASIRMALPDERPRIIINPRH